MLVVCICCYLLIVYLWFRVCSYLVAEVVSGGLWVLIGLDYGCVCLGLKLMVLCFSGGLHLWFGCLLRLI